MREKTSLGIFTVCLKNQEGLWSVDLLWYAIRLEIRGSDGDWILLEFVPKIEP